jgi:hypothetical protein
MTSRSTMMIAVVLSNLLVPTGQGCVGDSLHRGVIERCNPGREGILGQSDARRSSDRVPRRKCARDGCTCSDRGC